MNKFEKVSLKQYCKGCGFNFDKLKLNITREEMKQEYDDIKLPQRGTKLSAGYDFFSPVDFSLNVGESIKIPTGVRVKLDEDKVLMCFPRSGLGFKYRLQLDNTVGIVDSDYYYSDNEGHIFIKITNDGKENKTVNVKAGEGFAQGIIMQYFLTEDDNADGIRNGGFSSTDKK